MLVKITTVINYCTNDYRFIKKCIDAVRAFSYQIIIPVSDHFFDGTPENRELLDKTYAENPDVEFIEYEWKPGNEPRYWHNISRMIGNNNKKDDTEYVLFLDSDEIIDAIRFYQFIKEIDGSIDTYKIASYWYFREPIYRATYITGPAVLIKSDKINIDPYSPWEREQLFDFIAGCTKFEDVKFNGVPMLHHYSWVRTKDEMLKKVKSWGHAGERDWTKLVEEEFSRPFNGTDFVHGYSYDIVENEFNI